MRPCRIRMKAVDVCPVLFFPLGVRNRRRDVERVGESEGFYAAASEVNGPSDVRE